MGWIVLRGSGSPFYPIFTFPDRACSIFQISEIQSPPLFRQISTSRFLASVRELTPLNFGGNFSAKQGTTPISKICVNCESLALFIILRNFYLTMQSWFPFRLSEHGTGYYILNP